MRIGGGPASDTGSGPRSWTRQRRFSKRVRAAFSRSRCALSSKCRLRSANMASSSMQRVAITDAADILADESGPAAGMGSLSSDPSHLEDAATLRLLRAAHALSRDESHLDSAWPPPTSALPAEAPPLLLGSAAELPALGVPPALLTDASHGRFSASMAAGAVLERSAQQFVLNPLSVLSSCDVCLSGQIGRSADRQRRS
mmetsp:Transcript_124157/g.215211  ORF Transcript_124157/g.215211 Transcript_124157/m.215211 type:complete len:200 (+) Transcript_124157:1132-1731(+)